MRAPRDVDDVEDPPGLPDPAVVEQVAAIGARAQVRVKKRGRLRRPRACGQALAGLDVVDVDAVVGLRAVRDHLTAVRQREQADRIGVVGGVVEAALDLAHDLLPGGDDRLRPALLVQRGEAAARRSERAVERIRPVDVRRDRRPVQCDPRATLDVVDQRVAVPAQRQRSCRPKPDPPDAHAAPS